MKNVTGGLGILVVMAGCATGGGVAQRGTVIMNGEATRAFATGPSVVHAYSQDRGGRVFTVSAVTGTDADCASALARGRASTPLGVDHVDDVELGPGQVACLATTGGGEYELLWHARALAGTPATLALARR